MNGVHTPIAIELLLQFRHDTLNCSAEMGLRERLGGEVGVATRHQWFHAVGYSIDDLRVHWAFPQTPSVSAAEEGGRGNGG